VEAGAAALDPGPATRPLAPGAVSPNKRVALSLLLTALSVAACSVAGDASGAETDPVVAVIDVTVIPIDSRRVVRITGVIVRGKWYARSQIDSMRVARAIKPAS
jgi:hypothetical protein